MEASELVRVIRAVAAGESCLSPALAARLAARLARPDLSEREIEVLAAIVAGRSNKEIGADLFIAEQTVKNHVKSILAKLAVVDRTQAAVAAVERGSSADRIRVEQGSRAAKYVALSAIPVRRT